MWIKNWNLIWEGSKILWGKIEEMMVTSIFSFSCNVFKSFSLTFVKSQCCVFTHYHTMPHFDALKIYSCGKHCEKRRNCLQKASSPILTMFSTLHGTYFLFQMHFKMSFAISFNLDQSKILSSGNGLKSSLFTRKSNYVHDLRLAHSHTMTPFDASGKEGFWKHCGKRRNCFYNLLYPQCFLLYQRQKLSFLLYLSSANALNLV